MGIFGANRYAHTAKLTAFLKPHERFVLADRFRIMTPAAGKRTSFGKYGRANSRAIMD
jgi:hypothetical protein